MPYIEQSKRTSIIEDARRLATRLTSSGELNFAITRLVLEYLGGTKESYSMYNTIVGVLECVKAELYRRRIAPYEDKKRDENGEVY